MRMVRETVRHRFCRNLDSSAAFFPQGIFRLCRFGRPWRVRPTELSKAEIEPVPSGSGSRSRNNRVFDSINTKKAWRASATRHARDPVRNRHAGFRTLPRSRLSRSWRRKGWCGYSERVRRNGRAPSATCPFLDRRLLAKRNGRCIRSRIPTARCFSTGGHGTFAHGDLEKSFQRHVKAAGVKHVSPHTFRHSFATASSSRAARTFARCRKCSATPIS